MSLLTQLITLTFFTSIIIIGCKKEKSDTLTAAQEEEAATFATESETESEFVFNNVFDDVVGVDANIGFGGTGVFGRGVSGENGGRELGTDSVTCFTVTKTFLNAPSLFPVKIVIDFGAGCTDNNGHTRYGKLITVYTGKLINAGSVATTTFENFKIDSLAITGTHKITNSTASGSNQRQFTIDVIEGKVTRPNGNYFKWNSHRVITQVEGNATPAPIDDVFTITGSAHGRVLRGNLLYAWNSEIIEALRKRFNCPWISKGVIKVRRETLPVTSPWVAVLNYGNGSCDFLATLTINGITNNIQLPH